MLPQCVFLLSLSVCFLALLFLGLRLLLWVSRLSCVGGCLFAPVVRVFPCICVPLAVSFMCVGDWVCPSLFVVLLSVYFSCACLTVCVGVYCVSCMFLYVVGLYLW